MSQRIFTKSINGAVCEYDSQTEELTIRIKFKRGEGYSSLSSSGKTVLKADPGLVNISETVCGFDGKKDYDKSGFGFTLKAWSKEGVSDQKKKEEKAGVAVSERVPYKKRIAKAFQEAEERGFETGVKAMRGELTEEELPSESLTLRGLVSRVTDSFSMGYGSDQTPVAVSCSGREELPF
jgi:hypothetical protein